jgi:hypothetical protein
MIDLEKLNKEKYNGRGVIKRAGHVSDCNVIDVSKTDELTLFVDDIAVCASYDDEH